ncbi:MAG: preprotein translocase subunit SecA [Verrucomicrobiales bacterium]|jgi:preprotein translocase subunit SecA|nr:preprotein translocase subunit SecA [Verrucomicrobiales bacterium]
MLQWFISKIVGSRNQRVVKSLLPTVARINEFEQQYQLLSDERLQAKTAEFKQRLADGEALDALLPEAFAVVKNCCRRFTTARREILVRGQPVLWEMIPFDVQLIGGVALHQGKIAEMATGEGKTLVATLPVYLNALTGRGAHVVTVNDYLAARDSEWVGEVYRFLGLTVGCLQNGQSPDERRVQYAADITYGTNSEFGFDYLRDNGLATRTEEQVQRGHAYAIIDEVDSILIDEARTPLIISGPATVSTHQYDKFKPIVSGLVRKQHAFLSEEANKGKELIDAGQVPAGAHLLFKVKMGMPRNKVLLKAMEEPSIRRAIDDAELALYQDSRKTELYKLKEELYFTIEEKSNEADLSEMGREFLNPHDPDAFVLPDLITINHDIDHDPSLSAEQQAKAKQDAQFKYDDASQRIHNISQLLRAYCVFEKDVHYVVQENKVIIVDEYTGRLMPGRRWSEGLHQAVEAKEGVQIDRETQTLATITIQNYFRLYEKLAGMTGTAETEANEFRDIYKLDLLVVPPNKTCIRQDADDLIFKTRREKLNALIEEIKKRHAAGQPMLVGTASVESSEIISRILRRENIPHNVLNAKYHQQEAEIVARAGQRGAVTIATNMAGRGTDIKLGAGVAGLGGLHVIGTERHESRRIDRQLRGRCSRQGDPGSSQFFISFEDDLMRNFGDSRRISSMMTRLGMEEGEGLSHPWLNKTVENAQKRVEQRNYQIRKHTLQYDDVLNQQRNVIYTYRTDILTTANIRGEVFDVVNDAIDEEVKNSLTVSGEPDVDGLLKWLNTAMPLGLARADIDWSRPAEQIAAKIKERVHQAYETKIRYEQPDAVTSLERYIILNAIDRLWQEHLYAIDSLKNAIGLRAHGQKDPLIEYKQEGYQMFAELMANIKKEIVNNLFRSSSSLTAFEQFLQALPQQFLRPDSNLPGMSGLLAAVQNQPPSAPGAGPAPADRDQPPAADITLPIRRNEAKYGRNDLVTIRRGNETQTVKYKKAEPLLVSGWTIVGKAEEK